VSPTAIHRLQHAVAGALALSLGMALTAAIIDLPEPAIALGARVAAHLPESGVRHPVTAVLLNFRGYDTLLEVAVLLLAVLGVLALPPTESAPPPDRSPPSARYWGRCCVCSFR
jgi:multisubunit Na+/H+ antiporter MnhB subunit